MSEPWMFAALMVTVFVAVFFAYVAGYVDGRRNR